MKESNFNINRFEQDFQRKVNNDSSDLTDNSREIFTFLTQKDLTKIKEYYKIIQKSNYFVFWKDFANLQINLLWTLAYQDISWFISKTKDFFSFWQTSLDNRVLIEEEFPRTLLDFRNINEWFIREFISELNEIILNLNIIKNVLKELISNINEDHWPFDKEKFQEKIANLKLLLLDENISKWIDLSTKKDLNIFINKSQKLLNSKTFSFPKFKTFFIDNFETAENKFENLLNFYLHINQSLVKE